MPINTEGLRTTLKQKIKEALDAPISNESDSEKVKQDFADSIANAVADAFRDIINNTEADKYVVQYVSAYSDQILYSEHRISDPVVQAYNREGQKVELSIRVENNNITWTSTRRFSGKIIII